MKYPPKVHLWEILVRPGLWMRNAPVDKDFDQWMSDAMDRGEPINLCINPISSTVYEVEIAGLQVWVRNAPYADVTVKQQGKHAASRRTALRFRRALQGLYRDRFRFQAPAAKEPA